jgi:hypothetical protein
VTEGIIETKAITILQFLQGPRGKPVHHLARGDLGRLVVGPTEGARHEDRGV